MRILLFILLFFITTSSYSQIKSEFSGRWDSIINRAISLEQEGKFGQAISLLDSVKSIDSSIQMIYSLKAENLWMNGQFKLAAENYQMALLFDTDSSFLYGAYLFLGVLYEKANLAEQAQTQYLKAVYFFETKKHKFARLFKKSNDEDYALSLFLSGNTKKWKSLLDNYYYKNLLEKYIGKSRDEILKIYFNPYEF